MAKKIRALGVVLPQFHPIPENDLWWGKGFTEWTNVVKAKPRFRGHYQPHLPADLGFYDLRLEDSRVAQAELAKAYDIYGFCYYHYWFSGKRLLERPVNEIVASGKPDFPFCLCWANEPWSRNWDGQNNNVIQPQEYSNDDHYKHIAYLLGIFKDQRYIKVDGKPVFIVYRINIIPDVSEMVRIWNEEAKKNGFENGLYLIATNSHSFYDNPAEFGFNASWDFLPEVFSTKSPKRIFNQYNRLLRLLGLKDRLNLYENIVNEAISKLQNKKDWKVFSGVCPGWDNSPRRKSDAFILHNSSPKIYEKYLSTVCDNFTPFSDEENFIFLNAMNEWAEGNHLEPDMKWGLKYLEATKSVLEKYK